jgi:hypothetical protein
MAQLERVAEAAATFVVALVESPTARDLSTLEPNVKVALAALWKELDRAGCLEEWRRQHWPGLGLVAGPAASPEGHSQNARASLEGGLTRPR